MNGVVIVGAIVLLIVFLLGFLAAWRLRRPQPAAPEPPPLPPPPLPCPTPKIPDTFDGKELPAALSIRLAGLPADGSRPGAGASAAKSVIWVDRGDEVLVHLDSLRTQILDRLLLVSLDLETDQTGRTPLVVALAMGGTGDPAGLVAVTDELPRGNGLLASRWGRVLQDAVWAGLLDLAGDHAQERSSSPLGITASADTLHLHAGPAVSVVAPAPAGAAR